MICMIYTVGVVLDLGEEATQGAVPPTDRLRFLRPRARSVLRRERRHQRRIRTVGPVGPSDNL